MNKLLLLIIPLGLSLSAIPFLRPSIPQQDSQLKKIAEHLSVINFGPPSYVEFCGESVPVGKDEVKEKAYRRNPKKY